VLHGLSQSTSFALDLLIGLCCPTICHCLATVTVEFCFEVLVLLTTYDTETAIDGCVMYV
jgi:hypothetical protein